MRPQNRVMCALAVTLLIGGCGGGGGDSSNPPSTGPFSLQVVDDPVDPTLIDSVCIAFTAVTLHYADDTAVRLPYEPLASEVSSATHCLPENGTATAPPVKLDALANALSVYLVASLQVPTGRVTWMRLQFTDNSFIVDSNGTHSLICPSCEVTEDNQDRGIKLNRPFDISSAGISLIADIDLRQSLSYTRSRGYILRPTVRVEQNDLQGTIAGHVGTLLIMGLGGGTYLGGDEDTGCAVYVFPDDNSPLEDLHPGANVISTAAVRYTGEIEPNYYGYAAGALPVAADGGDRDYRVALTCDPDDPAVTDAGVTFTGPNYATVSAGQTVEVDFF